MTERAGEGRVRVDRERHGQLVVDRGNGDCFRACMSVLLDVPNGDHLPNAHDENGMYFFVWRRFLADFGMAQMSSHANGPIWKDHLWIASVPSKNLDGCTHAIVMRHSQVVFDPSPKRRYRAGTSLLGADVVIGGTWLEVADGSKLAAFVEWQRRHQEARAA